MNETNPQPRRMIPGQWFWLDKRVIREHQAKVGPSAFAVYCFLASCADKNQMCFPSQGYVARHLGCSRSTISRALEVLEKAGLIRRSVSGGGRTEYHLSAISPPASVDNSFGSCASAQGLSRRCTEGVAPMHTMNIDIQREKIKNNVVSFSSLAEEMAATLDNPGGLAIYEACVRKYPEHVLRGILLEVRATPSWRITKSRSHLFTHLLKKYAQ